MTNRRTIFHAASLTAMMFVHSSTTMSQAADPWVTYAGGDGPGAGEKVVLVSGDEEYRSEEALPQLGKILAQQHGFDCTVLFAVDPESGVIDANRQVNIPGLEALAEADLMIIFTRFRALPDEQMQHIDAYLKSGRPVVGIRTATHAFNFPRDSQWSHYSNGYRGDRQQWEGGFGRLVLGDHWFNHHGRHKHESTRGIVAQGADDHPITRGISDGDVWGSTDVYGVRLPLPGDSRPVVLGQVMHRAGDYDESDVHYGMRPSDDEPVEGAKNDPMTPIVWTKTYQVPDGEPGQAVMSTIGAAADLLSEGTRRVLVNAAYWAVGLEDKIPESGCRVDLVGGYQPSQFGFHDDDYWKQKGLKPEDFAWEKRPPSPFSP